MITVAIDGPAGVGKSTVSTRLASEYSLAYLDTGAMYRAATWWCLHTHVDLSDAPAVAHAVHDLFMGNHFSISVDPEHPHVSADGIDITEEIRSHDVSSHVSVVSSIPSVRSVLIEAQRREIERQKDEDSFSHGRGIIAEGRDITTVVAPRAQVRVLLTASAEVRQKRRNLQRKTVSAVGSDDVAARDRADSKTTSFTTAAQGVTTIDNSHMNLEETLTAFKDILDAAFEDAGMELPDEEFARIHPEANLSNAELEDYELTSEDQDLLSQESATSSEQQPEEQSVGVLAVVGRPNVGKSTLVNRILGRRAAIVQDKPGVTRDRVTYDANWTGHNFQVVDTGGWEVGVEGMDSAVADQAQVAVHLSDVVLFVVDSRTGLTDTDSRIVRLLRKAGKPVVLAVNKIDNPEQDADAADFWKLGMGEPHPISAMHGLGVGDLLDVCVDELEKCHHTSGLRQDPTLPRVALIGKPNVGKSSLLNQLAHANRAVVTDIAGTTRDPVDQVVTIGSQKWVVVDTAGIQRHLAKAKGADYYSSLRTQAAIERSQVCLVLFDVSQPISQQDLRVMSQAVDAGRAIVIVFNKWDLMDDQSRARLRRLEETEFRRVPWAEHIRLSAKTGWHTNRLPQAMNTALESWQKRITTSKLNTFFGKIQQAHPHPLRGGKQPRILFVTQADTCPPRIVIFATGFLDADYRRYLENQLRHKFGFTGTPIKISVRIREKKKRGERTTKIR